MSDICKGELPELLRDEKGAPITAAEAWEAYRRELRRGIVDLFYGGMPPEVEVRTEWLTKAHKSSMRVHCRVPEGQFSFLLHLWEPKEHNGPCPVLVEGDGCWEYLRPEIVDEAQSRGFAVAQFDRTEFAPDLPDPERKCGINACFPGRKFGALSAWAWGYHRVVDALADVPFADLSRVAITGHSRGGKTTLLAGATDDRIAFVNANCAGAGGTGCWRIEQYEDDGRRSERLDDLLRVFPFWLGDGMRQYVGKEETLPYDLHMLKALCAPRSYFEGNAEEDIWANLHGSRKTFCAALPAWGLYGMEDRAVFYIRRGVHRHAPEDFFRCFDAMEAAFGGKPLGPLAAEWKEKEKQNG